MEKKGRPSTFTNEIADLICEEMANGKTLIRICKENGLTYSTVTRHLIKNEDFCTKYAQSRNLQAEFREAEIQEIVEEEPQMYYDAKRQAHLIDPAWVNLQRLKIDTKKWVMSKILPKKYGDKQEIEHSGEVNLSLSERVAKAKQVLANDKS